ncbi:hypothetical protein Q5W_23950 [Hydrogenophaga sp. PBC]|nr:hypothetical protein Q5W_23950 [Hydrogenophaga sp. PBC]
MEAMRVAEPIETDAQTERELRALAKGRRVEARVQQRASVILLAAQGWQNKEIADEVKLDRRQVALWRRRFIEGGVQALMQDAARSGRAPSVTAAVEWYVLRTTQNEQPASGGNWSTRSLAAHLGISATTVRRVWQRNGIQPHVLDGAAVSHDPPRFEGRRVDVLGLFVGPFERALVLGCDDARPARAGAWVHDDLGTASLSAALGALERAVIPTSPDPLRHQKWLRFLHLVDRRAPESVRLHLIVDNHAAYRHPEVKAWLARRPRVVVHGPFDETPWLKRVRRILRGIADQGVRRHSFVHLPELLQAIAQRVGPHHEMRQPFVWTAPAQTAPTRGER